MTGLVGLRTGCLDDQTEIRKAAPLIEVYVEKRAAWKKPLDGAIQLDGQYQQLNA